MTTEKAEYIKYILYITTVTFFRYKNTLSAFLFFKFLHFLGLGGIFKRQYQFLSTFFIKLRAIFEHRSNFTLKKHNIILLIICNFNNGNSFRYKILDRIIVSVYVR